MQIFTGSYDSLASGFAVELARYRHRVFVEMMGWELQCKDELEFDQFDRDDTRYVACRDDQGRMVGCARLLPTTAPYLLAEVFPQLLHGMAPPCSPEVWELSRFAAVDLEGGSASQPGSFSPPVAVGLLKAALAAAAEQGATHVITVSPLGIERLLQRAGFRSHRAGPPVTVDGRALFACWIPVA
jgi:N-acyl-L-homoserine lactone synthetase